MSEIILPKTGLRQPYKVVMQIFAIIEAPSKEHAEALLFGSISIGARVCPNVAQLGVIAEPASEDMLKQMGVHPGGKS